MDARTRALLEPKKYGKGQKKSDIKNLSSTSTSSSAAKSSPSSAKPPSSRAYDPRALLNPKGSKAQSSRPITPLTQPQAGATDLVDRSSQPIVPGNSMLEDLYGVEHRSERMVKRIKLSDQDEDEKPKPKSSSARSGTGIIGAYLRPKDGEQQDVNSVPIDLTADDTPASDDDIQVIKTVNVADEQEVCFGTIHAKVQAYATPKPKVTNPMFNTASQWPLVRCTLHRTQSKDSIIEVQDSFDFTFGRITFEVAQVLAPVMDSLKKIRTQARLPPRPKASNEWPHQPTSGHWPIMINLYGRRGDVARIGKIFGQHNIWLANSSTTDAGLPVVNPHALRAPAALKTQSQSHVTNTRTVEEATEAVVKLFDHMANTGTTLPETEPDSIVTSKLLSHQKQALTFMLEHERPRTYGATEAENSSLWRRKIRGNGAINYEEVVTGIRLKEEPEQILGGLLADVMGLGKTLEALALVASTMKEAQDFGMDPVSRSSDEEATCVVQSRATLIVAPVSTVKNWEDQIAEHIVPGRMTYYVYHGANREKDPVRLADYDVVISTYGTIGFESSKKKAMLSPIQQIKWFRVVLDEAHTIRESRASQSQAMFTLQAQRRWALTGTAIQNRLEDLGSLCQFLKLYPYDNKVRFKQYILSPLQNQDFLQSLRVFIDSFTLRRLKDRIDLPKRQDLIQKLQFSKDERRLHDFFVQSMKNKIAVLESSQKQVGRQPRMQSSQVLKSIMTLRLICAHGRELLKEDDLARYRGESLQDAIDLDDDNPLQLTERQAYEVLSLMTEAQIDICKVCDKWISQDSPKAEDDPESVRAYVLPCQDLICCDCFQQRKPHFDSMPYGQALSCPYCSATITADYVAITRSVDDVLEQPDIAPNLGEYKKGDYSGPHTKTKALLSDINEMTRESQDVVERGEPPFKCVVFSEFTSHLDLIGRALNDHGYTYVRIDGSMTLPKRKQVLDALSSDDAVTILLASIKAAGQGLNLTAASRAFIMEPLWNPAAEAQAVDRIYRIGQKREVIIKRYHMDDSMEDKILELQKKKQELADVSMSRNHKTLSKKETREMHIQNLKDLFK